MLTWILGPVEQFQGTSRPTKRHLTLSKYFELVTIPNFLRRAGGVALLTAIQERMPPFLVAALCSVAWLFNSIGVRAQYPPPLPSAGVTTIRSPINGNVTIRFKTPPVGTCTTVFSTQKQYTGYVTLPPNTLIPSQGNYTINTFFWFIEARQLPESAPLTIWINGGPGSSSMVGLFQENGPCEVVEIAQGQLGTRARDWGWDRGSNMLYVDQPAQVGFSYDTPTNASLNFLDEQFIYPPTSVPYTQPGYTFLNGTFSSGISTLTANTSDIAAQSIWHFLQGFLASFPQYNPGNRPNGTANNNIVGINLFTESYGGKYGPAMASFFETQNAKRLVDPSMINNTLETNLVSLGIINGMIDILVQTPFYPRFAYNNTYGFSAISLTQELNALSFFSAANGCQQLVSSCRTSQASRDPYDRGNVQGVNDQCAVATKFCQNNLIGPFTSSGRNVYDISQSSLDPFPDSHYLEYLNSLAFQNAIGTPVNYTQDSAAVLEAYSTTGDYARGGQIADLAALLGAGVRVALIYGDRDYICNWFGGEAISFAIAGAVQPLYAGWYSAGYGPIVPNSSYIGGEVRQFGNLSFSRVYDSGHLVPAYQPETAFTIFSRIIEGSEIGLGQTVDLRSFGSTGEANSTHQNVLPPMARPTCNLRAVNSTCNTDQKNMLANEAGVIINGVLYDKESDWTPPPSTISMAAGKPGNAPTSMIASPPPAASLSASSGNKGSTSAQTTRSGLPTGVYVATGTPSISATSTKKGVAGRCVQLQVAKIALGVLVVVMVDF